MIGFSSVHNLLVCNFRCLANLDLLCSTASPIGASLDLSLYANPAWQQGPPVLSLGNGTSIKSELSLSLFLCFLHLYFFSGWWQNLHQNNQLNLDPALDMDPQLRGNRLHPQPPDSCGRWQTAGRQIISNSCRSPTSFQPYWEAVHFQALHGLLVPDEK